MDSLAFCLPRLENIHARKRPGVPWGQDLPSLLALLHEAPWSLLVAGHNYGISFTLD